jgi:hypothetical protein
MLNRSCCLGLHSIKNSSRERLKDGVFPLRNYPCHRVSETMRGSLREMIPLRPGFFTHKRPVGIYLHPIYPSWLSETGNGSVRQNKSQEIPDHVEKSSTTTDSLAWRLACVPKHMHTCGYDGIRPRVAHRHRTAGHFGGRLKTLTSCRLVGVDLCQPVKQHNSGV